MSSLFSHADIVFGSNQSIVIDDHRVDHVSVLNPETGLVTQKPVAATAEEIRLRELASLRRGLESVEYRLANLDPNDVMPWEEPVSEERMAKIRAGLEAEREYVLAKLAELDPPAETKLARR